jgi:hypothetical protein
MSLMSMHFPNWKSFHEWYRSYADKAETALKEVTQSFKQFELDWWDGAQSPSPAAPGDHLAVVSYVNQLGFGELIKNLNISVGLVDSDDRIVNELTGNDQGNVDKNVVDGQLAVLSSGCPGSPASSRIVFECNWGLVLARTEGGSQWLPVAQTFPRYRHLHPFSVSDRKRMTEDEVWTIIKSKQVGIEDLVSVFPPRCFCSMSTGILSTTRRCSQKSGQSDIDWSKAEACEMLDGHLGVLFCHRGRWRVQIKARRDLDRPALVDEFWRLFSAQGRFSPNQPLWSACNCVPSTSLPFSCHSKGITEGALNSSWCYIFQMVPIPFTCLCQSSYASAHSWSCGV